VIKLIWDQRFKRIYKNKVKNNEELKKKFWETVSLFSQHPFDPRLRTHKLTGKLKGLWAFSVNYECRVIFSFLNKNTVLLIDIGGHDEVY